MYVCLCNRVTDRQLVEAASEFSPRPASEDASSFAEAVADRLGAGLGCGTCRNFALDLVVRAATGQSSVVLPDREHASFERASLPDRRSGRPYRLPTASEDDVVASPGD